MFLEFTCEQETVTGPVHIFRSGNGDRSKQQLALEANELWRSNS